MKLIYMYIGHENSVGVCFAKTSRIASNPPSLFTIRGGVSVTISFSSGVCRYM